MDETTAPRHCRFQCKKCRTFFEGFPQFEIIYEESPGVYLPPQGPYCERCLKRGIEIKFVTRTIEFATKDFP